MVNRTPMSATRIDQAMTRITAAMSRIDAARLELKSSSEKAEKEAAPADGGGSARVMALVNAHEKLREEVADTLGELDTLIGELEGE